MYWGTDFWECVSVNVLGCWLLRMCVSKCTGVLTFVSWNRALPGSTLPKLKRVVAERPRIRRVCLGFRLRLRFRFRGPKERKCARARTHTHTHTHTHKHTHIHTHTHTHNTQTTHTHHTHTHSLTHSHIHTHTHTHTHIHTHTHTNTYTHTHSHTRTHTHTHTHTHTGPRSNCRVVKSTWRVGTQVKKKSPKKIEWTEAMVALSRAHDVCVRKFGLV